MPPLFFYFILSGKSITPKLPGLLELSVVTEQTGKKPKVLWSVHQRQHNENVA